MKDSKEACGSAKAPKPNLKNPKFVNWSKSVSCKQEDNIVSSEWKEKLKSIPPFLPAYDNKPVNMIYLLSGEYGRLWKKERDDWYGKVFVLSPKEKDMNQRKKKLRKEIRESKKAAEIAIQERKERRAKEIEAKAKAEAEKYEKLKARIQKLKATKLQKAPKKSTDIKPELGPRTSEPKEDTTPKENKPEKSSLECERSDQNKETINNEEPKSEPTATDKKETEPEKEMQQQTQESDPSCVMCDDYVKQLQEVHEAKCNRKDSSGGPTAENETEEKTE